MAGIAKCLNLADHRDTGLAGGAEKRCRVGERQEHCPGSAGVPLDEVETRHLTEVTIRPVACREMATRLGPDALPMSVMQSIPQIIVAGTGGSEKNQSRDLLPGGRKWTVSDFAARSR